MSEKTRESRVRAVAEALKAGQPPKVVAREFGFSSATALTTSIKRWKRYYPAVFDLPIPEPEEPPVNHSVSPFPTAPANTVLMGEATPSTIVAYSMRIRSSARMAGIHHWKDAPEPVHFLRYPHRHIFHFEVLVSVGHGNRDVEFFIIQQALLRTVREISAPWHHALQDTRDFGERSCEMIAQDIFRSFDKQGYRIHEVLVSEDGENAGLYSEGR